MSLLFLNQYQQLVYKVCIIIFHVSGSVSMTFNESLWTVVPLEEDDGNHKHNFLSSIVDSGLGTNFARCCGYAF